MGKRRFFFVKVYIILADGAAASLNHERFIRGLLSAISPNRKDEKRKNEILQTLLFINSLGMHVALLAFFSK